MKLILIILALVPWSLAIFGGTPAKSGQFPSLAQLHVQNAQHMMQNCGGSIISSNLILTAAHCVASVNLTGSGSKVKVIAGELRWGYQGFTSQTRMVKEIIVHEDYDDDSILLNDVAVLVLSHPLVFTDFVQPITIPAVDQVYDADGQIAGWGDWSPMGDDEYGSTTRHAEVRLVPNAKCEEEIIHHFRKQAAQSDRDEKLRLEAILNDGPSAEKYAAICAVGQNEATICQGYSGGPLICYKGTRSFVCGIITWSVSPDACGKFASIPTAFTAVANYSAWINDRISEFSTTCGPNQFHCGDGNCVPRSVQCDRKVDCARGTDEINCGPCESNQFLCTTKLKCIDASYICDGTNDCGGDASDERGCGECRFDQFKCADGMCIEKSHVCDGKKQCSDARDEIGCGECSSSEFQCKNGKCVHTDQICDGVNSCRDGSDEMDCGNCTNYEFQCSDSTCVGSDLVCDHKFDCPDGSDEHKCSKCGPFMFECATGACVQEKLRCDSKPDCAGGSDELNCPELNCRPWQFRCGTGHCIEARFGRCDQFQDCVDGSDELNCSTISRGKHSVPSYCRPDMYRCNSLYCIQALLDCRLEPGCIVPVDPQTNSQLEATCQSEYSPTLNANDMAVSLTPGSSSSVFICETYFQFPSLLRPRLRWHFNGEDISNDPTRVQVDKTGNKLLLQLTNVTQLDQGYYKCSATNVVGQDEVYVMIQIENDNDLGRCERNLEIVACKRRGCVFVKDTKECVAWSTLKANARELEERDADIECSDRYTIVEGGIMDSIIKLLSCLGAVVAVAAACVVSSVLCKRVLKNWRSFKEHDTDTCSRAVESMTPPTKDVDVEQDQQKINEHNQHANA